MIGKTIKTTIRKNAGTMKPKMTDEQAIEGLKDKLVRSNLKNFCRSLVDAVDEMYGPLDGDSRKYWHGLVIELTVDCAHELSDAHRKEAPK